MSTSESELVLSYLLKHGLTSAASQLTALLQRDSKRPKTDPSPLPPISYDIDSDNDDPAAGGPGYDLDAAAAVSLWGVTKDRRGSRSEAKAYIEGFTSLVTWVLSLPDDPANVICANVDVGAGADANARLGAGKDSRADESERQGRNTMDGDGHGNGSTANTNDNDPSSHQHEPHPALATLVQIALAASQPNQTSLPLGAKLVIPSSSTISQHHHNNHLILPPSCKPELLSLTFPLMVHTYCKILSCNLERTARTFLQTYRHLYEPLNPEAIADLDRCPTTQLLVDLNEAVVEIGTLQNELRKLKSHLTKSKDQGADTSTDPRNHYDTARTRLRLKELAVRLHPLQKKVATLPFLKKVCALKWNVTVSTSSFSALTGFASGSDVALPMMGLLQTKCHLIVERRDPVPFCPVVLEEGSEGGERVNWATPVHPAVRTSEAGSIVNEEDLPFPKYRLEEGREEDEAARSSVEFNRALLVNGFRRLEALERKREYESGVVSGQKQCVADPLAPSILLGSLCCSSDADVGGGAPWMESNIGITSASISPPDGRRVAVGCDDAAVRVWSLDRPAKNHSGGGPGASTLGEPSMVLLGHSGFPVFDVDWTRNGRTLLSAGGDGTIRLWDTEAVGPYGRLSNISIQKKEPKRPKNVNGTNPLVEIGGAALAVYRGHAPSTSVWSVSSAPSGYYFASAGSDSTARIWTTDRCTPVRVLRGHISPSVNGVTWHPNCNYVLTASDDKTCRMWDIQTGKCVRILSGSSRGLNIVRVSPTGRFAAGAGYDNIVRIWDLGNGRLVNQLRPPNDEKPSFSNGTIHSMAYSSCGSALAVTGEDCILRIWDVRGVGKHLSNPEYFAAAMGPTATSSHASMTTQGRVVGDDPRPGTRLPTRLFKTNNISVLDLKYTKRNLLLAVGSYSS